MKIPEAGPTRVRRAIPGRALMTKRRSLSTARLVMDRLEKPLDLVMGMMDVVMVLMDMIDLRHWRRLRSHLVLQQEVLLRARPGTLAGSAGMTGIRRMTRRLASLGLNGGLMQGLMSLQNAGTSSTS